MSSEAGKRPLRVAVIGSGPAGFYTVQHLFRAADLQIRVDMFEGPLDLLLFLIRRHQVDVFDIPMAFVCEKYFEYLKLMKGLNIDVASASMLMAPRRG